MIYEQFVTEYEKMEENGVISITMSLCGRQICGMYFHRGND